MTDKRKQWASVKAKAKPVERTAAICLDGSILGEIEVLLERMAAAKAMDENENRTPQAPEIARQVVALTKKAKADETVFVFRSVGRTAWRELVATHPPKPDDAKKGWDYDPTSFPLAAMQAACVDPEGVDFDELAETVSQSQWDKLWAACHAANAGNADVPFIEAAFELARPTATKSGPLEPTDSPEVSS